MGKGWGDECPLALGRMTKDTFLSLLSRGSVVVKHDVLLKASFTPEYEKVLKNATKKIEQKINDITNDQVMKDNNCSSKFLGFWGGA